MHCQPSTLQIAYTTEDSESNPNGATPAAPLPRFSSPRRSAASGRPRARPVAARPRHVLWRRRRLRHNGWRVRVREPVQPGVRHEHGGAEHGAVQQGPELRLLLRAPVHGRPPVVPPWRCHRHGDGHKLLPSQLRAPGQRRRLVQPAAPALRPRRAGVPPNRAVQRRDRPGLLPPRGVRQEGRRQVHSQRPRLLQPGARHQRRRRRRRALPRREGLGVARGGTVAAHVPQLGAELAEQRVPQRPGALLPPHRRRWPLPDLRQRRARRLAVRPDLRGQAVLLD